MSQPLTASTLLFGGLQIVGAAQPSAAEAGLWIGPPLLQGWPASHHHTPAPLLQFCHSATIWYFRQMGLYQDTINVEHMITSTDTKHLVYHKH